MPGQTPPAVTAVHSLEMPSMEGRAIARPNQPSPAVVVVVHLPSMEGRAIARPNPARRRHRPELTPAFNGGPGNCPAKPQHPPPPQRRQPPFNGGPGNCPAKPDSLALLTTDHIDPSMEGRAIARPNGRVGIPRQQHKEPSMEGRAIARPNFRRPAGRDVFAAPSMEGRAIARPNVHRTRICGTDEMPSMEGRAIARPNHFRPLPRSERRGPFNGGPGNCPAKLEGREGVGLEEAAFNGGPGNCPAKPDGVWRQACHKELPSMEGRAIARPNPPRRCPLSTPACAFNGGPGNCPAKLACQVPTSAGSTSLQWRAGQLPGQTLIPTGLRTHIWDLQWRAGQLPGQTRPATVSTPAGVPIPSMEGRAIARPNRSSSLPTRGREIAFNGGPGNCPAKLSICLFSLLV